MQMQQLAFTIACSVLNGSVTNKTVFYAADKNTIQG